MKIKKYRINISLFKEKSIEKLNKQKRIQRIQSCLIWIIL